MVVVVSHQDPSPGAGGPLGRGQLLSGPVQSKNGDSHVRRQQTARFMPRCVLSGWTRDEPTCRSGTMAVHNGDADDRDGEMPVVSSLRVPPRPARSAPLLSGGLTSALVLVSASLTGAEIETLVTDAHRPEEAVVETALSAVVMALGLIVAGWSWRARRAWDTRPYRVADRPVVRYGTPQAITSSLSGTPRGCLRIGPPSMVRRCS
jgi:hypothetical protein